MQIVHKKVHAWSVLLANGVVVSSLKINHTFINKEWEAWPELQGGRHAARVFCDVVMVTCVKAPRAQSSLSEQAAIAFLSVILLQSETRKCQHSKIST